MRTRRIEHHPSPQTLATCTKPGDRLFEPLCLNCSVSIHRRDEDSLLVFERISKSSKNLGCL